MTEVAATIVSLAEESVFPGEPEFLKELPDRTVKAASFDAFFRIQSDRLDWSSDEERSMVVVRFAAAGEPLTSDSWSLRIRGTWPNRRDRLPDESPFSSKSYRNDMRWRTGRRSHGLRAIREPGPWGLHENLWIVQAETPKDQQVQIADLEAQLGLFLLQIELVPPAGDVRDRVVDYLRRNFSWRGIDDPDAAAVFVYAHLRKHKWWPDEWRAWRLYVRKCINGEIRKQVHRAGIYPDLTPDQDGNLTVDQFAYLSKISRSKAYALVHTGRVSPVTNKVTNRLMIPLIQAERFRKQIRRADLIASAEKTRSREAARKWVYRQERSGKTPEEIARKLTQTQAR